MAQLHFTLRRRYFAHGTFGELYQQDGQKVCVTLERPWLNNAPFQSCVPEGEYTLKPHTSPTHGECLLLTAPSLGVTLAGPSLRTHILFHAANRAEELHGCIAPGQLFGVLEQDWAVLNSARALERLLARVGDKPARLTIIRD